MVTIELFENEIVLLKKAYKYGSYEYSNRGIRLTQVEVLQFVAGQDVRPKPLL